MWAVPKFTSAFGLARGLVGDGLYVLDLEDVDAGKGRKIGIHKDLIHVGSRIGVEVNRLADNSVVGVEMKDPEYGGID
jgi:hypothetical protein